MSSLRRTPRGSNPFKPQSDFVGDEDEVEDVEDDEDVVVDELEVLEDDSPELLLLPPPLSFSVPLELAPLSLEDELVRPLAEADDARESVIYQPLPLKTMPTG